MLNQPRDGKDHLIRGPALLELPVDLDPEVQVVRILDLIFRNEVTAHISQR